MENIILSENERTLAYLLLRKRIRDNDIRVQELNEIKREITRVAIELEANPEDVYALYRRIRNEICEEAKFPETMEFKQGSAPR